MATPYHIRIPAHDSGILKFAHSQEEADKVSELLQKDLENHHVFFNDMGFHDHIVHHLLTLYGTGSGSKDLQLGYDNNTSYQLKAMPPRPAAVEDLEQNWSKYLGKGRHYPDFLRYFQVEMEQTSWQEVMKKHLFSRDERSRDLFGRLFAGFLHPLIQLMYGIEWEQPAIVAQGLAQAAVHENRLGDFLTQVEQAAAQTTSQMGSIADFFAQARQNAKLAKSAHWEDPNRIYDGVMVRAPDEAVELLSRVRVEPEELEERTAEMFHASAYLAAGAAFHPPHIPKFDFFLMHHINSAPFFLTINKQPWIPTSEKVRLLEWKIRIDVVQYVARGCPLLQLEAIKNYTPKDKALVSRPQDLLPRFHPIPDDGHLIKLVRALMIAQNLSDKYAHRPWIQIRHDDTWLRAYYMMLDGSEIGPKWVRSAGFEEAWKEIPKAE